MERQELVEKLRGYAKAADGKGCDGSIVIGGALLTQAADALEETGRLREALETAGAALDAWELSSREGDAAVRQKLFDAAPVVRAALNPPAHVEEPCKRCNDEKWLCDECGKPPSLCEHGGLLSQSGCPDCDGPYPSTGKKQETRYDPHGGDEGDTDG